jgi:hypothetical protein
MLKPHAVNQLCVVCFAQVSHLAVVCPSAGASGRGISAHPALRGFRTAPFCRVRPTFGSDTDRSGAEAARPVQMRISLSLEWRQRQASSQVSSQGPPTCFLP